MSGIIRFLTLDQVLRLHSKSLAQHGGTDGIRDMGLLQSAIAQPAASFGGEYLHASLFEKAAAYAFHIAENQPFLDGNKRTALLSALVFMKSNGVAIRHDPRDELYPAMIALANRQLDKSGLAALLRRLASEQPKI